jgi:hypothetical protein
VVATVGVLVAVVVTAVNLSVIGWNTYDPRLAEVNQTNVALQNFFVKVVGYPSRPTDFLRNLLD